MNALSSQQLAAVTPIQLAALPTSQMQFFKDRPEGFRLSDSQQNALSKSQMDALYL
jgi:hypothetical protein